MDYFNITLLFVVYKYSSCMVYNTYSFPAVCADLPAIDNGVISYSSADMPRPIGTVASYACNDGFNLDGPDSRTCVENAGSGMFDMTAPTCIRKFISNTSK